MKIEMLQTDEQIAELVKKYSVRDFSSFSLVNDNIGLMAELLELECHKNPRLGWAIVRQGGKLDDSCVNYIRSAVPCQAHVMMEGYEKAWTSGFRSNAARALAVVYVQYMEWLSEHMVSSNGVITPKPNPPSSWPTTKDAAIAELFLKVNSATLREIKDCSDEELYKYHHGLGTMIRNNFGLWLENEELRADCGFADQPIHEAADGSSYVILKALRDQLRIKPPYEPVRTLGANQENQNV